MTANVVSGEPAHQGTRVHAASMTEKNIRQLPVMDEGRVVGMVSIRDIVSDIIADQRFLPSNSLEPLHQGQ